MIEQKKVFVKLCVSKYNTIPAEAKMMKYNSYSFFPQVIAYSLDEYSYVITEFIDTVPLEKKELTDGEKHLIVSQAVRILEWMEEEGIMHRDIRPENLMLSVEGKFMFFDFGWAIYREDAFQKTEYEFVEKIVNIQYRGQGQKFDDAYSLYQSLKEIWGEESEGILAGIKERIGKFAIE